MFIPIGTNLDSRRRPVVVPALVALNLVLYFGGLLLARQGRINLDGLYDFGAIRWVGFHWWQPITYQFLHDPRSIMHVLSNMIFLWAFGAVVEGRLGRAGFLALYLVGGAFAGVVQVLLSKGSAVGASGSVSVVAGAFLALHPRGVVHGYWLLPPMRVAISAAWLLGLYAAIDFVNTFTDAFGMTRTGVGTVAHLSGLLFGLVVSTALLATGVLARNDFDLFFLMKQWKRRRELREVAAAVGVGVAGGPVAARVSSTSATEETPNQRTLRSTIAAAYRERDYVLAAQLYVELLGSLPEATLPAEIQLDVANELARSGRDREAARAYGRFIERFRTHHAVDDARLMLAAIQVRRLGDAKAGLETLSAFDRRELAAERAQFIAALRADCGGVRS